MINLHIRSSGSVPRPTPESPLPAMIAVFTLNDMSALVEWIFAKVPIRFPDTKIAMSEAGFSWVPTIKERLPQNDDLVMFPGGDVGWISAKTGDRQLRLICVHP